ncbi:uncharacterized protein TNCV_4453701 [Trichonephila clavipes]|nr:uncharacterized protein TNCV_4453701 [Trichonephila clavipes]
MALRSHYQQLAEFNRGITKELRNGTFSFHEIAERLDRGVITGPLKRARWAACDPQLGRARYSGHPPNDTLNPLRTYQLVLLDFTQDKLAILKLNCQRLRAHQTDFLDVISQNCTLLMLSETWLDNDERISISNYDCCVLFKRPGHRAAGVEIYSKQKTPTL